MNEKVANKFGLIRLLLATMVVASHSPELLDGNRSRELLTMAFGTASFGEVGVFGFFLVSGYLITKSAITSPNVWNYLLKRILRIVPGFAVAFIFTLIVVGWLAGGDLASMATPYVIRQTVTRLALLHPPEIAGTFAGLPYPQLNGSMWTISYEFRCYLLVMALCALGVLRHRAAVLMLAVVGLLATTLGFAWTAPWSINFIFGDPGVTVRLTAIFLLGAATYLYRDRLPLRGDTAFAAAVLMVPLLFLPVTAVVAWAVLGGYVLLWFAFSGVLPGLGQIGARTDISYGLYLYAWPVQNLLVMHMRDMSPWTLFGLTMLIAGTLGYLSWVLVEKPFLALKSSGRVSVASLWGARRIANP